MKTPRKTVVMVFHDTRSYGATKPFVPALCELVVHRCDVVHLGILPKHLLELRRHRLLPEKESHRLAEALLKPFGDVRRRQSQLEGNTPTISSFHEAIRTSLPDSYDHVVEVGTRRPGRSRVDAHDLLELPDPTYGHGLNNIAASLEAVNSQAAVVLGDELHERRSRTEPTKKRHDVLQSN